MVQKQTIQKRLIVFFAYVKYQGITEHFCNMALAVGKYTDILVVYDKKIEANNKYINVLQENNIECVDILELRHVIVTRFKSTPLLFHCQGFVHLKLAKKHSRSIDKIMISLHCFRQALWYGKFVAILTYSLFFRTVDMWHILCHKNREDYFWFRNIPANTSVFPLGVEELFMTKTMESCMVKDLEGGEITDIPERVNIVYIAQFQPWKRHRFLLQSLMPILKGNTHLYLLGEGPTLGKVMGLAKELGIRDHVTFTGKVDRKTVHYILSHATLAVTVSNSETFGWCLLEPFCMDVPIVTTNVGIANSIIHDFYNGFILNPNCTEEQFLEKTKMAMKYLRDIDNSEIKHLYLWDTFGRTTVRCYDSMYEVESYT